MTRIFFSLAAAAVAFVTVSCCCTSEPKAPGLRRLPAFQEIPAVQHYEVVPTK
jgi:hypothetical protein